MLRNRTAVLLGLAILLSVSAIRVSAATRTTTIHIEGMHCNMCSASIAKALKATPGVEKAEVDFEKGVAVIQYDDEKVNESKLREVINSTGYKVVEQKTAETKK